MEYAEATVVARGTPSIRIRRVEDTGFPTVFVGRHVAEYHDLANPLNSPRYPVYFTGGEITVSMERAQERSINLTGVQLSTDALEAVRDGRCLECYDRYGNPIGVFLNLDLQIEEPHATFTIDGEDESSLISKNQWNDFQYSARYAATAGTIYDRLGRILLDVADIPIGWPFVDDPPGWMHGDPGVAIGPPYLNGDPWEYAQALAELYGLNLYIDGAGVARLRTFAEATGGRALGEVTGYSPRFSLLDVVNTAVALGEGAEGVRQSVWVWYETAPYGRHDIGQRLVQWQPPEGASTAEKYQGCWNIVRQSLSRIHSAGWSQLYDPDLDVNQVYTFDGVSFRVESYTIPLNPNEEMKVNGAQAMDLPTIAAKIVAASKQVIPKPVGGGECHVASFKADAGYGTAGTEETGTFVYHIVEVYIDPVPTGGGLSTGLALRPWSFSGATQFIIAPLAGVTVDPHGAITWVVVADGFQSPPE